MRRSPGSFYSVGLPKEIWIAINGIPGVELPPPPIPCLRGWGSCLNMAVRGFPEDQILGAISGNTISSFMLVPSGKWNLNKL